MPPKKQKMTFEIEDPVEVFGNLQMINYFAHGADVAGIQWDRIDLPGQVVEKSYANLLMKIITTTMGKDTVGAQLAPGSPHYRVGLFQESIKWTQLNLGFKSQAAKDLFTNKTPLSTILESNQLKKHFDEIQDALCLASKKIISGFMGILSIAAAAWYKQYGHGSLVVETENWANFVDMSPEAQQKCVLWLQWVPEKKYASFSGDFGSASFLATVRSNAAAGFNLVPRDGTGYRWNGLCVPHLPELLVLPELKTFVGLLSAPGKCTLAFSTMEATSGVLIGAAGITLGKHGAHTVSRTALPGETDGEKEEKGGEDEEQE